MVYYDECGDRYSDDGWGCVHENRDANLDSNLMADWCTVNGRPCPCCDRSNGDSWWSPEENI